MVVLLADATWWKSGVEGGEKAVGEKTAVIALERFAAAKEMAVTRSAYLLCLTLRIRHDCSKGIM